MGVEIERKFLVNRPLWDAEKKGRPRFYQQGYLSVDADRTVRVRLSDDAAFITVKGRSHGASRLEFEYAISTADAKEMLTSLCTAVVSKYRYKIEVAGKCWEVDEFTGENAGLLLAEIELSSETETFSKPSWAEDEVTTDHRYYNSFLAQHPFSTWKEMEVTPSSLHNPGEAQLTK